MMGGKSWAAAARAAFVLKAGGRAASARLVDGKMVLEEIVCVPGFDDGRQLEGPTTTPLTLPPPTS